MHNPVFLDYASSTPVREDVYTTYMKLVRDCFVNSQAVYKQGVDVDTLVETSRKQIAKLLGVRAEEVLFTSGASEANSFAIKGYGLKNKHKGKHIITTRMEHSSVLESVKQLHCEFDFDVTYLNVDKQGKISLEELAKELRQDTILVSIMCVNNEIGSVQNIADIATLVHQNSKCKLHVDAVQAMAKVALPIDDIDLLTITAHKLYGVKGCGVLLCKQNIVLLPLINGGQQERGLRGGTLNAPSCIVFAKTLRLAMEEQEAHFAHVSALCAYLRAGVESMQAVHINSPLDASPYIFNFSCLHVGSEIMLNALNDKGICVSTQSTCASKTKAASHTLEAMGESDAIKYGAIRVSLSHLTTMEELDYFLTSVKEIMNEYTMR